jgi:hypothetical protein
MAKKVRIPPTASPKLRELLRGADDPAYQARVKKALAGRTVVRFVKDLRRQMEAEDRRRRDRPTRRR